MTSKSSKVKDGFICAGWNGRTHSARGEFEELDSERKLCDPCVDLLLTTPHSDPAETRKEREEVE